jgi:hypothetical protein
MKYLIEIDVTPKFGDPKFLLPTVYQKIEEIGNGVVRVVSATPKAPEQAK